MTDFLGEHEVKLDGKGRFKLPASLKRQLEPSIKGRFVVNRGFEKCLVLYPYNEWEEISKRLGKLNTFKKANRDFIRYFRRGARELVLDNTDRLLIPKELHEHAGLKKELILAPQNNTIEIWDKERYLGYVNRDSDDFADMAEDILGQSDFVNDDGE